MGGGRAGGSKRFTNQVLRVVAMSGGPARLSRPPFLGSRIGRGVGVGRVLAARGPYAASRQRFVITKTIVAKIRPKGLGSAKSHLRYIQRDGVTREGEPGQLYAADKDRADGKAFIDPCADDRHQFRLTVSAEDGEQYDDLKPLTRRLMARVEDDLGTRIEWVAADHYNTGHPHTHVVMRGVTDRGEDLIIARDYLTRGLAERAAELVELDLGPKTDREIERHWRAEIEQERFTSLDQDLVHDLDEDGLVRPRGPDALQQTLRAGRLQKLKRFGLAEETSPGAWRLDPMLEPTLNRMGERAKIIVTMNRDLIASGVERALSDCAIYDPQATDRPLIGRLIRQGILDRALDQHYLIIDGLDGRAHYVDTGQGDLSDPLPEGAMVAVTPRRATIEPVDHAIAKIAAAHDGRYSSDLHLQHDPAATAAFAENHSRRLEMLRRFDVVDQEVDGTYVVARDHLQRVQAHEDERRRREPVAVQLISTRSPDQMITLDGPTWLDRQLLADTPEPLRDRGFGRETRGALAARRQWLIAQNLAYEDVDRTMYRANLLQILQRRDLAQVGARLSKDLGVCYVELTPGARIEGVYRRSIDSLSGRLALVERSLDFTLVPWRPDLEPRLGRQISGVVGMDGVSWTPERTRSGPTLS